MLTDSFYASSTLILLCTLWEEGLDKDWAKMGFQGAHNWMTVQYEILNRMSLDLGLAQLIVTHHDLAPHNRTHHQVLCLCLVAQVVLTSPMSHANM